MKTLIVIFCAIFFTQYDVLAQAEFELEPSQSMSITGKGPGQDAMKNPYDNQNCYAIVENIGKGKFSVRIQQNGVIIKTIIVKKGKTKKALLLKGYELYLDANSNGQAKAKVAFEKMTE